MILFENDGEIDIRSITTFGASSKDSSSAIGYFGTGLKYAIAILLREGCGITIYSGLEEYRFGVEASHLRNNTFNFVTLNDVSISFTTELGKNWELWQAFRELYCNCIDEQGTASEVEGSILPEANKTKIVVTGNKFEGLYAERYSIVRESSVPITTSPSNVVYYKGVKVHVSNVPMVNTYNVPDNLKLTEDRTVASEWDMKLRITQLILESDVADVATRIVEACEGNNILEGGLYYSTYGHRASDVFKETVSKLYAAKRYKIPTEMLKVIGITEYSDLPEVSDELDTLNQKKLDKAINFCEGIGYHVTNYPIIVTDKLKADTLGLATKGNIYISYLNFDKGTKYLASTLIEEYIHNKYGYQDETYELQTFLFDNIVTLGERLLGEPI